MPMTDALQEALSDPNTPEDQVIDLLKKDGVNSRETLSLDTPLILATRYNNLFAVQTILETIKVSPDKYNILNATNNHGESPLSLALNIESDKKIALLLIQDGADTTAVPEDLLSFEGREFLRPFVDYEHLKHEDTLNHEDLSKRADAAYEIACHFNDVLGDIEKAYQWVEVAANDNHKDAILTLASHEENTGNLANAIYWYKRCYPLCTDEQQRQEIVTHLSALANTITDDQALSYEMNKTLGLMYIGQGDISTALTYLLHAEESFNHMEEKNQNDALFFTACSLWNGPSREKNTTVMDCLNFAKRIELLIEANTEDAHTVLVGIASSNTSVISQLIACQLGKDHNWLAVSQLEPLSRPDYQPYLDALSFLYGWNGKPKNTLRGASLLKKLIEVSKSHNPETEFLSYTLIAFAYLQQESEKEIYICEAFQAMDDAHACLGTSASPHRNEILHTILDGVSYAQ